MDKTVERLLHRHALETVLVPAKKRPTGRDHAASPSQDLGTSVQSPWPMKLTTAGMVLAMPPEPVSQDDFEMQRERLDRLNTRWTRRCSCGGSTLGDGDDDGKFIFSKTRMQCLANLIAGSESRHNLIAAVVRLHGKSDCRLRCRRVLRSILRGGSRRHDIAEELVAAGAWDHSYKFGNLLSARRSSVVGKKLEPDLIGKKSSQI